MSLFGDIGFAIFNPAGAIIKAAKDGKQIDQLKADNEALKQQNDQQIKDLTKGSQAQTQSTVSSAIGGTGSNSTILIGIGAVVLLLIVLIIIKLK